MLNYLGWLRAAPVDEVEGLDSRYHKKEGRSSTNTRFTQSTSSHEEDNPRHYTADSRRALSGRGDFNNTRSTDNRDDFEDHGGITPRRREYELRFTADAGGGTEAKP